MCVYEIFRSPPTSHGYPNNKGRCGFRRVSLSSLVNVDEMVNHNDVFAAVVRWSHAQVRLLLTRSDRRRKGVALHVNDRTHPFLCSVMVLKLTCLMAGPTSQPRVQSVGRMQSHVPPKVRPCASCIPFVVLSTTPQSSPPHVFFIAFLHCWKTLPALAPDRIRLK